MVLIAENLHIISKVTKEAIASRNSEYVLDIVKKVKKTGLDIFDLNIGPAKGAISGSMKYLTELIDKNYDVKFSFDTSNFDEMKEGFLALDGVKCADCFINSICADEDKIKRGLELASEYGANVIALTFNPVQGIAKTSDERVELAFSLFEKASEFGIEPSKLYFDPLVLPVSAAQNQAEVVIETIRMIKEGMDDVHTIVGLSNISNGSPKEVRPLLNRVFLVLAMGAGLDSAIVDGLDFELQRIYGMINNGAPECDIDKLCCSLYNAVSSFESIDDIEFNKEDISLLNTMKAAKILLNGEIYSHSFCARN